MHCLWLQEVCIPSAGVLALPALPEGAALRPQARKHPPQGERQVRHQGRASLQTLSQLKEQHPQLRELLCGLEQSFGACLLR